VYSFNTEALLKMIAAIFIVLAAAYMLWKLVALVCFTAPDSLHHNSLLSSLLEASSIDSVLQKQAEKNTSQSWKSNDVKNVAPDGLNNSEIEPLNDFDYTKVDPIKYRPFLTMPHVSMGMKL
jgi:hypothetical protein